MFVSSLRRELVRSVECVQRVNWDILEMRSVPLIKAKGVDVSVTDSTDTDTDIRRNLLCVIRVCVCVLTELASVSILKTADPLQ